MEQRITHRVTSRPAVYLIASCLASAPAYAQQLQNPLIEAGEPMSEEIRASIDRVVIKPGESPTQEEISGTYEKQTYGLEGGMVAGGTSTTMNTQLGGVNVAIPIPILQFPAMIFGGIAGATQKEIQDFRDALTEELADASSQQIINDKIAADVYNEIRTTPGLATDVFSREVEVPDGTDAVVYVSVKELLLFVEGNEAIITTTAKAALTRESDGRDIYETTVYYQDRDKLGNWTRNDNALWKDYANFARHYVGRELAGLTFESAGVAQRLQPVKTRDVNTSRSDPWSASTKKRNPMLAWQLDLPGDDADPAWAADIDESSIHYELEIYDMHRPVYTAGNIAEPSHEVAVQLEPCADYRWSVRPVFRVNGTIRYGAWMRSGSNGNGNIGVEASEAPAYLYDFAQLEVRCGSK